MHKSAAHSLVRSLPLLAMMAAAGCASSRPEVASVSETPTTAPATTTVASRARIPLEKIEPEPQMPAPREVVAGQAPLDAIALFAEGRNLMNSGQFSEAAIRFEKALLIDHESFELYFALGQAYLDGTPSSPRSLEAFEKAVELRPTSLAARVQLGRQYLGTNNLDRALHHLRLAIKTDDYAQGKSDAPAADLFLARTLQRLDYSSASLDRYKKLLGWIDAGGIALRANPEMAFLLNRPEIIYAQIADLAQKLGRNAEALEIYRTAASHDPENLGIRITLLQMIAGTGDRSGTASAAADLLVDFNANSSALGAVRTAYDTIKRRPLLADDLQRWHRDRPDDRALLLALIEVLQETDRVADAQAVLEAALKRTPSDAEIVRRLVTIHIQRDDIIEATRLLVEAAAEEPDILRSTSTLWTLVLRPSSGFSMRIRDLQELEVSDRAQAAKLYWIARLADVWNRQSLSRASLEQAVNLSPPFAPAYRLQVGSIMSRSDLDDAQKRDEVQQLIARARAQGNQSLAFELRGLQSLIAGEVKEALVDLNHAMALHPSPDIRLEYAEALFRDGQNVEAEQVLWQLARDWPTFPDVYQRLFVHYSVQNSIREAVSVLQSWLQADPNGIEARTLQMVVLLRSRRPDEAERVLLPLLKDAPDQQEVLDAAQALYGSTGRMQVFINKLEEMRTENPANPQVVERLVDLYVQQSRRTEASRVLDATCEVVAEDPDLLYYVGHLYMRVGQPLMTEKVYEQVLKIDPRHPAASNDLGYTFADKGQHLDRAETLIRVAVESEPDNHSFLDSLGWVLYKRGKFEEARDYLQRAIGEAARPDPVVLDHLGDTLYRLGEHEKAVGYWQRALERLPEVPGQREELMDLRLALHNKLRQVEADQPVQLAPVADEPATAPATTQSTVQDSLNPE